MSLRSSILSLLGLLGALGLGYAVFVKGDPVQDQPANEAALDRTVDQPAQDQTPALAGSADRLMDDFGQGPLGTVVTVPLRERHQQAFGSGGGAASTDQDTAKTPTYRVVDRKAEIDPEQEADTRSGKASPEVSIRRPSFDIVRVDPEGNTVLAGRASPFAEVEVKVGDEVIDRVTATALGEWVSTPIKPLPNGDQELSLAAANENEPAVISKQVVVVSIPEPAERQIAEVSEPVAVLLDREKAGEGRVLQAPGRLQGEGELALKLVDYNDEGAIKLSGEAPPGVPVRIYIDNEPTALVIGDAKGQWIATLDRDLPGGDYTLRLDQLDRKGETVARLETPFTRVTTPPVEGQSKVDYVVVQPGNSLWRIARRLSGDGFNYVYLFEANQAQIRDPDVIYPGQVFEVPADTGIAG